jgi:assimilatory nitrate reductase catalytic subunit
MPQQIRTTCPYCGVGCGVLASVDQAGGITIKGDPDHPANYGRLCSKGAALGETLGTEGRLLYPEIEGTVYSWDDALDNTARKLQTIIAEHGPDAVAFYVSGQLLTEDYYVANKLMKGFIGSANIDTNSRLCMSSAVAAHKRAFGADCVPCAYEDLEQAELITLVGSNTAWCHPVLYQRIAQARKQNSKLKIVVIDPRKTATCDIADLHLPLAPGSDNYLFNGLLTYLDQHHYRDQDFIDVSTEGLDAALDTARSQVPDVKSVAMKCGLNQEQVEEFFQLFAKRKRSVTVFSQGINQWSYGTDKGNSIINCHLLTGRIGRPGMGPFSFTGQPNAMGGREVGGLANQLAAHMNLNDDQHRQIVKTFWDAPVIAENEGLKAIEMFDAMAEGKIKAVWIMATNPAVSLPDANKVRAALEKCKLVIVSDCMRESDTSRYAHVLFPARAWGERDGTVTNSERLISRQRAFIPTSGSAQPDWWIITRIAQRMGFGNAFAYKNAAEIFREHAALSGFHNQGQRDFNLAGLSKINATDYEQLTPVQWPVMEQGQGTVRLFTKGKFFTPSGKAQFIPVADHGPANAVNEDYPLVLNTGRIRDQWHTMTRTGKSARLSGHIYEPFVSLHPEDASLAKIVEGSLVKVSSRWGEIIVRARLTDTQQIGNVFVPMHWNDQYASKSYVDALVNPVVDPVSGQPEFKHTPVQVKPYQVNWYGFLLTRRRLSLEAASYWSCSRGDQLWRYEIAGEAIPDNWPETARSLLCQTAEKVEWIEYHDRGLNRYRAARIENGRLESCIFIGPDYQLPERDWLVTLFADETLQEQDRSCILSGNPAIGQHDVGRTVCACFGVGRNVIMDKIREHGLVNAEEVGEILRAGTNCGSCIPEIKELIAETHGDLYQTKDVKGECCKMS